MAFSSSALPAVLIDAETRTALIELFAALSHEVELHTYAGGLAVTSGAVGLAATSSGTGGKSNGKSNGKGETPAAYAAPSAEEPSEDEIEQALYEQFTVRLCRELAGLSSKLRHIEHQGPTAPGGSRSGENADGPQGEEVSLIPTLLLRAKDSPLPVLRMSGAPLGEEARALIQAILLLGAGDSGLSGSARKMLAELKEPRHVRVFSSPGCPYCPGQALNAFRAAMERPDLVKAECVTADEFPALSRKYGVGSVPHTQFSEHHAGVGLMSEVPFVYELAHLAPMPEDVASETQDIQAKDLDLVILGGGPAGLSAGIYAARSGLKTALLERSVLGGQMALTPVVENYPAFASVGGQKLSEIMASHARQYIPVLQGVLVQKIERENDRILVHTPGEKYRTKAILFATGAEWKDLGVPGEDRLRGKGVVHCATCDGYLFKGKKVVVVGGGNTALTDALHLKNLGVLVSIMHRRDAFKAEAALQKAVEREQIPVIWNSTAVEVLGEKSVTGLRIRNTATHQESTLETEGVFVAVGQKPNAELAAGLGAELTETGNIKVDARHRTSVPGVYAAGDVCGGVQQIVTAVSAGADAALAVFEDLQKK